MSDKEKLIGEAIQHAQVIAKEQHFDFDQLVAHPDHPRICKLRGVEGDIAYLLDKETGMIEVDAARVFDPLVAEMYVTERRAKRVIKVLMN
jgi:hypothetical protein